MPIEANGAGWTIVVIGPWNPAIFSPDWVSKTMTKVPEIGIDVGIGAILPFARLRFEGLIVTPTSDRLVIAVDEPLESSMSRARDVAVVALNELSHTPVRAVGVNFQFLDKEPSPDAVGRFDLPDNAQLADQGFRIAETVVRRRIESGSGVLNLSAGLRSDASIVYDFNYHADVAGARPAAEYLSAFDVRERLAETSSILTKIGSR